MRTRLLLLVAPAALACASTTPSARPAPERTALTFTTGDVVEHYGAQELALREGPRVHRDAAGRRFLVREEEDPRLGCALLDAGEPPRVVGHFALPTDDERFDHCSYMGGAPDVGTDASAWVLASVGPTACAHRVDALLAALQAGRAPTCDVALSLAGSPSAAPPAVVGWLDAQRVVLKTPHCCGSSRYHVVDLASGRAVGLGMSFESSEVRQYPALRPLAPGRSDHWLVQRADDPGADWPTAIAVVPCARVADYVMTGEGAHSELRVDGRRLPAGAALTVPATLEPCTAGQSVRAP